MPWTDRAAAALGRMAGTRGVILCFHGLDIDDVPSPSSMHVPLDLLESIIATIQALWDIVPLRDVVARHLAGRSTAGLVALTADDAYVSWLAAEPLLQRQGVPLTVFGVSEALARGQTFWWDRIDESAPRVLPERWRRFEDECGLPEAYRRGQPVAEGPTRPLRQWILAEHAGRWPQALEGPLCRLESEVGPRTAQRSMTELELSGFMARTGAEVGIHTISHAALPFLPDHEVVGQIRECHDQLRARFGAVLPYLAIPFGLFEDRTLRLAAEAGMMVSLTLGGSPLDQPFAASAGVPRLCVVREHSPGILALKSSSVSGILSSFRGRKATAYPILPSAAT